MRLGGLAVVGEDPNAAIRERANFAIAEAFRLYALAGVKLGFFRVATADVATAWILGTTNVQHAITKNFLAEGKHLHRWATEEKAWAEAGKNPAGNPYTWTRWADSGKTYLEAARYIAGLSWDASALNVALATVVETARQVNPAEPKAWPSWLKAIVVAGSVLAGAYVLNSISRAKHAFSEEY